MILGFKPYQFVGFQFDGVTSDKKIVLINSRLLNVDFFFYQRTNLAQNSNRSVKNMNSECPLQKLKWNSFCSLQWRKDKERRIFVILLLKRHLMYVNIFRFWTSNFFTDDGCEHANMKQFTFVAGNIRSQYTLFCENRWIFNPKL